jgi:small subunit ribosomal protein S16
VAVKLRLMRMGKKKQPTYRVVAADSRSARNGGFIQIIGVYDPRQEPSTVRIDNARAVDWLYKGAKPTDTVEKLLRISGAWGLFEAKTPVDQIPAGDVASASGSATASSATAAGPAAPSVPGA